MSVKTYLYSNFLLFLYTFSLLLFGLLNPTHPLSSSPSSSLVVSSSFRLSFSPVAVFGQKGAIGTSSNLLTQTGAITSDQQKEILRLLGSLTSTSRSFTHALLDAFRVVNPRVLPQLVVEASPAASRQSLFVGSADFAIVTQAVTDHDKQINPNSISFPFALNPLIPVFNLPSLHHLLKLTFDGATICRMLRGNITHWDDPSIVSSNKVFSKKYFPHKEIQIVMLGTPSFLNQAICNYCSKVDKEGWMREVGITMSPQLPNPSNKQNKVKYSSNVDFVVSDVLDSPYSFSIATNQAALATIVSTGNMINAAGKIVSPTAEGMVSASASASVSV